MKKNKELFFFFIILLIAIFLRFWKLNSIPPGLYPDIAINGNDALDSLENKNFKVFYPENNGREGMMMWLIAFSFLLFGKSILSIKITAALVGVLTLVVFYFLSKEISIYLKDDLKENSDIFSYIATLSLATSFWHINFSRIGFRAILLPLFISLPFYFILRGIREKKLLFFIISGFALGLGLYTYSSFRMIVFVILIVAFIYFLISKKENNLSFFFKSFFIFFIFTLISSLPFFLYIFKNPSDFVGRASQVFVFSTENPIKNLLFCFIKTLGMFLVVGDKNWRHNISGKPNILFFLGIFLYIGVVILIYKICKNKNLFKEKNKEFLIYLLLLSWFFFLLSPGFLTVEGIPHSIRTIGVLPVVFLLSTYGLLKVIEHFKIKGLVKRIALILFSFILVFFGYYDYFVIWARSSEIKGAFSENYVRMGEFLNSLPNDIEKYVIVNQDGVLVPYPNGIPMPAQTLIFVERTKFKKERAKYLKENQIFQISPDKESIILMMRKDEKLINELYKIFPKGQFQELDDIFLFKTNP